MYGKATILRGLSAGFIFACSVVVEGLLKKLVNAVLGGGYRTNAACAKGINLRVAASKAEPKAAWKDQATGLNVYKIVCKEAGTGRSRGLCQSRSMMNLCGRFVVTCNGIAPIYSYNRKVDKKTIRYRGRNPRLVVLPWRRRLDKASCRIAATDTAITICST